ncbi:MAG: nicotinate-nucleotide adenylyltransferase [Burkholderiaceae bacterium]|nr:nicotinate-nucleotide adenylyltransferase [Burkholderiaceae bacterium]
MSDAPGARGAHGASPRRRIGLLGGTFDPVHVAHVALARAALAHLALDELRFVPTGRSWQKVDAGATAQQRIEMLHIATVALPRTSIDERETKRAGASYTIDTLIELRAQLGEAAALVWIVGSDQLRNLPTWHRWEELLRHAHLAVARRAGDTLEALDARVRALVDAHACEELPDAPAGSIVFFPMPSMQVSGSALRDRLARGECPDELLPHGVLDYIDRNRLYRATPLRDEPARAPRPRRATKRNRMDPRKLQRVVVDALDDIKAQDIRVFDTTAQTELFDRVIIATGTSNRQTRALASHVRDKVKEAGAPVVSMEGADTGEWVLVDLGDIVVHVMQPAIRQYYNLEELWGTRPVRLRVGAQAPAAAGTRSAAKRPAAPKKAAAKAPVKATGKVAAKAPAKVATKAPAKTATKAPARRTATKRVATKRTATKRASNG